MSTPDGERADRTERRITSTPVRLGVIGLGEVAQVIHLPILASRPELFEIAAVCDVSPTLVSVLGDRYHVRGRHSELSSFLDENLDAVLVLTSDEFHADCVVAACQRGLDVFVEKPICLGPVEAESIVEARDRAGVHVMVGYMRRYAPAFVAAVEKVDSWDTITYASLRDIIGVNRLLIDQTSVVERPDDIPTALGRERERRAEKRVREAIGDVPPELNRMYRLLCGLASHDISAMRELLGQPRSVASAAQWQGGNFLHIVFDYGHFGASLDVGVDRQKRFDCFIEVGSELGSIRVTYDTPYIRHLPTTLTIAKTEGEAHETNVTRPTFKDPYMFELEHFHRVVTERQPPKTDVEDSLRDLELFRQIVEKVRPDGR